MWIILGITRPVMSVLRDPRIYPHLWITCGGGRGCPSQGDTAPVNEFARTVDEQPTFFRYPQTTGRHPRTRPQLIPNATARFDEGIPRCAQNPHPL